MSNSIAFDEYDDSCRIVNDIQLVKTEWLHVVPDCHPLDYERLLAIQKSMSHQFRFYYIIHYTSKGECAGVQYLQHLPFKAAYYDSFMKRNYLTGKLEELLIDNHFSLLICGSLFSVNAPGFLFDKTLLNEAEIFEHVTRTAYQIKKSIRKTELVFKDIPEALRTAFEQGGFESFDDDVTMSMRIDAGWNSFDDYIRALKHKYAQRARKIIKAAASIERRELSLEDIHQYQTDIQNLFMQVVSKQTIRLGIPGATYFIELKKAKPETFSVCGYFLNDKLVAFATYIVNHKNDELHYIGFDYALNKTHYLYFNILFDSIRKAIEKKIILLEMGRTAREAKSVVGAKPMVFHSYIQFSSGISRYIYGYLKKRFQHKTEHILKDRHPFKVSSN